MSNGDEKDRKWQQRVRAFKSALEHFQKAQPSEKHVIASTAHVDLGNTYWTLHERDVRPHILKYSSRFKMASLTEKTIFLVQPFRGLDGLPAKDINALFGFSCALGLIREMKSDEDVDGDGLWETFAKSDGVHTTSERMVGHFFENKAYFEVLRRSISQHLLWLETHDRRTDGGFPLFHNATFLDLFWHSCHKPV